MAGMRGVRRCCQTFFAQSWWKTEKLYHLWRYLQRLVNVPNLPCRKTDNLLRVIFVKHRLYSHVCQLSFYHDLVVVLHSMKIKCIFFIFILKNIIHNGKRYLLSYFSKNCNLPTEVHRYPRLCNDLWKHITFCRSGKSDGLTTNTAEPSTNQIFLDICYTYLSNLSKHLQFATFAIFLLYRNRNTWHVGILTNIRYLYISDVTSPTLLNSVYQLQMITSRQLNH